MLAPNAVPYTSADEPDLQRSGTGLVEEAAELIPGTCPSSIQLRAGFGSKAVRVQPAGLAAAVCCSTVPAAAVASADAANISAWPSSLTRPTSRYSLADDGNWPCAAEGAAGSSAKSIAAISLVAVETGGEDRVLAAAVGSTTGIATRAASSRRRGFLADRTARAASMIISIPEPSPLRKERYMRAARKGTDKPELKAQGLRNHTM